MIDFDGDRAFVAVVLKQDGARLLSLPLRALLRNSHGCGEDDVPSVLKVAEDRCNTRKSEKTARVDGDDADDGALSPSIAAVFSFFLSFLDLFKTSSKPLQPQLNPQPTRERTSSASSTSETSPTPSSTPCPSTSSQTPSSSAG